MEIDLITCPCPDGGRKYSARVHLSVFNKCKKNSFMDWMEWSQLHDKDSNYTAVICCNLPTKRGCFASCCCIILKLNYVFTLFLLSPFPVNEGDTSPAAPHTKLLKCLSPKHKRIIRVSWYLYLARDGDFWSYREPYFPSLEHHFFRHVHLCHNTDFCFVYCENFELYKSR